jgi:hypothetical protein
MCISPPRSRDRGGLILFGVAEGGGGGRTRRGSTNSSHFVRGAPPPVPPRPPPARSSRRGGELRRWCGRTDYRDPRGPSPPPAFCSFLATAADPSPNFGGGVVWPTKVRLGELPRIASNRRPGEGRRCVRDARPQGREPVAAGQQPYRCPDAEGARRRWQQSYRCLRRAQPGPERSGGTRPKLQCESARVRSHPGSSPASDAYTPKSVKLALHEASA